MNHPFKTALETIANSGTKEEFPGHHNNARHLRCVQCGHRWAVGIEPEQHASNCAAEMARKAIAEHETAEATRPPEVTPASLPVNILADCIPEDAVVVLDENGKPRGVTMTLTQIKSFLAATSAAAAAQNAPSGAFGSGRCQRAPYCACFDQTGRQLSQCVHILNTPAPGPEVVH